MNMHHHITCVVQANDVAIGLRVPVSGALSSPDRAPSPTCPFIKINNVKEPSNKTRRTVIGPDLNRGPVVRLCRDGQVRPDLDRALLSEPAGDRSAHALARVCPGEGHI